MLRFDHFFGALQGFGDAGLVEGFQDVIHRVYIEGLDGVIVEGGGEDDLRDALFAFEEFFDYAEAVEAGHLHVEEDEIGIVFFDEREGFEAVFAQGDHVYFGKAFQEIEKFVPRGAFVVNDDGIDGHGVCTQPVYASGIAAARNRGD